MTLSSYPSLLWYLVTNLQPVSVFILDEAKARLSTFLETTGQLFEFPHYDCALALSATCASITSFTF